MEQSRRVRSSTYTIVWAYVQHHHLYPDLKTKLKVYDQINDSSYNIDVFYLSIYPNLDYACALDSNGDATYWRYDGNGQASPTTVLLSQNLAIVAEFYQHTCGRCPT